MSAVLGMLALLAGGSATGDDLYRRGQWSALAADQRAGAVGDVLTVVVFQSAEASNSMQNSSRKRSEVGATLDAGSAVREGARVTIGGGYAGRGDARRSERLVTRLSVTVSDVLPNGDLIVTGRQRMHVNGERTEVRVRGRVRPVDISGDNAVLSTRIADAEIDYGGRGFVSRGAGPGLVNRLFALLGLG
ncbi:flagellar basal body L-ring protein FlgH [Sphingomonas sp. VNH70]|uniref:flagellar basal body L-ring protein FlgH n=1 Tax=Sphingomonas silueang TaxID=3156617 RepID=UPI0032B3617B